MVGLNIRHWNSPFLLKAKTPASHTLGLLLLLTITIPPLEIVHVASSVSSSSCADGASRRINRRCHCSSVSICASTSANGRLHLRSRRWLLGVKLSSTAATAVAVFEAG